MTAVEQIKAQIAYLQAQVIALLEKYKDALQSQASLTMSNETLYQTAKANLGKHLTLDSTVPGELGCAEAVSKLLTLIGFKDIPARGIAGTTALYAFLQGKDFKPTATPARGSIVISPTGYSTTGSPHGHVGVVGDSGIMSNDSDTGLWAEKYTTATWQKYFHDANGFPVFYFDIA